MRSFRPFISLPPQWLSLHALAIAVGLLVYILLTHVLQQRRSPSAAVGWVLLMVFVPYVGLPLYLLFGTRKFVLREKHSVLGPPIADEGWARQLAASLGQPPVTDYRDLAIHANGTEALAALWAVIDSARNHLDVSTFLIGRDKMGDALVNRLRDKAQRGVRVRLLLDGVGRMMGGWRDLETLRSAGVQIALFVPLLHSPLKGRTNLRNHRKMVVADNMSLWCGGRNFAAEYFEGDRGKSPWHDLSFDLRGSLTLQMAALFQHDWDFATGAKPVLSVPRTLAGDAQSLAQVIASGPDQTDDTVHAMLVTGCFNARHRILAATPYFVPDEKLFMALALAARRGVTVDLLLPVRSNHRLADLARHRALRELATNGVRIWFVPYMLHAKAIVMDDMAMAGSLNLDVRSLFLNYELMVVFYGASDVARFTGWLEEQRNNATRYCPRKPTLLRDLAEGLVLWLAFQL